MALPKRIIKETERLMAEPYAYPCAIKRLEAEKQVIVFQESVLCHMTTTSDTSMSAYMDLLNLHMKVCI